MLLMELVLLGLSNTPGDMRSLEEIKRKKRYGSRLKA
jgi:hypothetical protein